MHFTSTVALISATLSLASALPAASSAKFAIQVVPTKKSGSALAAKDQFITLYHTGAGENVPVLTTGKAPLFALNGTKLVTEVDGTPYGFAIGEPEDLYANWGPLTIDAGDGENGFKIVESNTIISTSKDIDFGGWRVCTWVHNVPELYVNLLGAPSGKISNPACEPVTLIAAYAPK